MTDYKSVNEKVLGLFPDILFQWMPGGELEGNEFVALNPNRPDEKLGSFSINTSTGLWSDFATGEKGDAVGYYAYIKNLSQSEAATELSERAGNKIKEIWTPITPIPADAPEPYNRHPQHGEPSKRWKYVDCDGNTLSYVCRFETKDGKQIAPLTYCKNGDKLSWKWKNLEKPRPLFNLDRIKKHPTVQVIIVSGEKCAEALQNLSDKFVVTTWMNGDQSVKHTDWSPLKGRNGVIWPDNDDSGNKAAMDIFEILKKHSDFKLLKIPGEYAEKWDVADGINGGWNIDRISEFVTNNKYDPKKTHGDNYYRPLGYDHGKYFYLSRRNKQIITLSPTEHNKLNLSQVAPMIYFNTKYSSRNGTDWNEAAESLMNECTAAGIYDSSMLRGCGAWFDKGRIVVHKGNYLIVDGYKTDFSDFITDYIYEKEKSNKEENISLPALGVVDAVKYYRILETLLWEDPAQAILLSGWLVCASICGALNWRPHIQISGQAGSGKSWVLENIVKPVLGSSAISVMANTSEAGIRQTLGNDAYAVLFDEAEGEDKTGQSRMQHVMELMRQASSESGGSITKGTAGGKAITFQIRSCFCLSSIGVQQEQHADVSRISILSLKRNTSPDREQHFDTLRKVVHETITYDYCYRFRKRAIELIPSIRKNALVFAKVGSKIFGTQRTGDQIGTLMAGAYSLMSDKELTYDEAKEWVDSHKWESCRAVEQDDDSMRCFNHIMQQTLLVKSNNTTYDKSISELVLRLVGCVEYGLDVSVTDADNLLRRHGIKYKKEKDMIFISNSHLMTRHILKDTAWSKNWGRILARMEGAEPNRSEAFHGIVTRATGIPAAYLMKGGEN